MRRIIKTQISMNTHVSRAEIVLTIGTNVGYLKSFKNTLDDSLGNVSVYGKLTKYNNIATAAYGAPPIFGSGANVSLGTTSTAVASYTPAATGMFRVIWFLRCVTASTPTLTLTFTDEGANSQSITLFNSAMVGGTVQQGTYIARAASTAAVAVAGLDSIALGDIFASATIEEMQ